MKKMLALALVLLMVLGLLSTTAFADEVKSPTDVVETDGNVKFVDTDVELTDAEASKAAGVDGLKAIWTKGIESESNDPTTVTITVPGSEDQTIYVYQYINDEWVLVGSGKGPSITVTLDPRYPVGVAVGKTPQSAGATSGDKSPATGMDTTPMAVCCIAVLLAVSVCAAYRKKTAQ